MSRIVLLSGMLAVLAAAGATTVALRTIKPETVQPGSVPGEPVNPAILKKHLQNMRHEMVLP
jgi:hypothetical protein